jgi:hypothetical protein
LAMLYLIAKHLLSDSYGPLDRLLELGVFLFRDLDTTLR